MQAGPGKAHGERAEGARGGTDRVVPPIYRRGARVFGGEHRLLQRGRRAVIHHIGGQGAGERDHQQRPQRRARCDHHPRGRDPAKEQRIGAPAADPVTEPAHHQAGQRRARDQRRQHHSRLQVAEPAGGQQRPEQDRGEPVPGGPHPLRGHQQPGIPGQARPPGTHRITAKPATETPTRTCTRLFCDHGRENATMVTRHYTQSIMR